MFRWMIRRLLQPFGASGVVQPGGLVCATPSLAARINATASMSARVNATASLTPRVTATAGLEEC